MSLIANTLALYQDGEFDGTLPQLGAVAGRIDEILAASEIVARTVAEFRETVTALGRRYGT